jgi:hypothetical protein
MRSVKNKMNAKRKEALDLYERYPSRDNLLRILNMDPDVTAEGLSYLTYLIQVMRAHFPKDAPSVESELEQLKEFPNVIMAVELFLVAALLNDDNQAHSRYHILEAAILEALAARRVSTDPHGYACT